LYYIYDTGEEGELVITPEDIVDLDLDNFKDEEWPQELQSVPADDITVWIGMRHKCRAT